VNKKSTDKVYKALNYYIEESNKISKSITDKYKMDGQEYKIFIHSLCLALIEDCLRNNKLSLDKKEYSNFKDDFKNDIISSIDNFDKNEEKNPYKGEKTYLFSEDLREKMSKYGHLSSTEALSNKDFMDDLLNHAGVSQNKIDDLLKFMKNSNS